jgi:hypothetical protein
MMIAILLVVIAILVLCFLFGSAKGQALLAKPGDDVSAQLRYVDLEAFRNLIDPDEEDYLRSRLSPAEFRLNQKERMRAALEYVSCAARNARVLLSIAQPARVSPDPAVAAMAEKLIDNAIRLRLYALQMIPRLYIAIWLPVGRMSPVRVADRYEQITRQVILLGLQYPTRGVSRAL